MSWRLWPEEPGLVSREAPRKWVVADEEDELEGRANANEVRACSKNRAASGQKE